MSNTIWCLTINPTILEENEMNNTLITNYPDLLLYPEKFSFKTAQKTILIPVKSLSSGKMTLLDIDNMKFSEINLEE
ncbi:MAG: hypothetical protein ACFFD1_04785 [Candidatus Thorarchaeota archaeon]